MISLSDSEGGDLDSPEEMFSLGRVVVTKGALATIPHNEIQSALRRHHRGDWGEIDEQDQHENVRAIRVGSRVFSQYRTKSGVKFWIITECDRSLTTILLPSEY